MANIITPRRLAGFLELDPIRQIEFDNMVSKIKEVFARHCFVPLDTPVLELSEILLAKSGGDIDKEIFRFTKGSTDMCMRYDLTVPLARYVAMNLNEINFPFKRYQIGKVYRGERPQKGRFREFTQCDADIIGSGELSIVNDAECISLYIDCFKALNLDVTVEISNRKLINGLISDLKLESNSELIFKTLDKLDKIGSDEVVNILVENGITQKAANLLLQVGKINGNLKTILPQIESLSKNEEYVLAINELKELNSYLIAMGINENNFTYNLSIIRGHNYYTGTVFEAYLNGHRDFGAVGAGGRYDNLSSYYTETKLPGVGMSIGLTRLFDLLSSNNLLPEAKKSNINVLIIPIGDSILQSIELCKTLRENDILVDVSAENKSFKSKLKDANKREVPYIIILGEDEAKSKIYTLKDMSSGAQFKLDAKELIKKLKN